MQSLPTNYLTDPSITIRAYAEIWTSLNGGTQTLVAGNLPLIGGTVTIDRNNTYRRSASNVTMLDPNGTLTPTVPNGGELRPYGYELKIFKGIDVGGVLTYAQLGTFLLGEVDVKNDSSGLQLVGTLRDRGEWISRLSFAEPAIGNYGGVASYTADQTILFYIAQALYGAFGSSTFPFPYTFSASTYVPPPSTAKVGDDPWRICSDIAAAAGMQLFFDYTGTLILQPVPTPGAAAVTFAQGTPAAPHSISRLVTNQGVANVVCVEASGSKVKPPIKVWWWDSQAGSPMFFAAPPAGNFSPSSPQTTLAPGTGSYPVTIDRRQTSLANTAAQAQAMANMIGAIASGASEKATFALRDYPGLDVDDVVGLSRPVAGIPVTTDYVIDAVQIGLDVQSGTQFTGRPTQWVL